MQYPHQQWLEKSQLILASFVLHCCSPGESCELYQSTPAEIARKDTNQIHIYENSKEHQSECIQSTKTAPSMNTADVTTPPDSQKHGFQFGFDHRWGFLFENELQFTGRLNEISQPSLCLASESDHTTKISKLHQSADMIHSYSSKYEKD